jgi:hypothetical protein
MDSPGGACAPPDRLVLPGERGADSECVDLPQFGEPGLAPPSEYSRRRRGSDGSASWEGLPDLVILNARVGLNDQGLARPGGRAQTPEES